MTEPVVPSPNELVMNYQVPCTRGDHHWLPWLHVSPSIWRTVCAVCKTTCAYDQGEWRFRS